MEIFDLTEGNFKEYGSILRPETNFCERAGSFNYYPSNIIDAPGGIEGGFLEVIEKVENVKKFERHNKAEEVIMPLKGSALLYIAGRDDTLIKEKDIKIFNIQPGIGVRLNRGVWHAIPVLESCDLFLCLILKTKNNEDDTEYTEL